MPQRVSTDDWPRLTRFYGIAPSALAQMPHALLRLYAEQLMTLSAEEALLGFITADMPYAAKGDRTRIHRAYERHLDAPEPEKVDVRTEQGAAIAAGFGIGVHLAPGEVESRTVATDA